MAECNGQEAATSTAEEDAATISSKQPLKTNTTFEDTEQEKLDSATKVTSHLTPLLIEDIDGESVPESYSLVLEAAMAHAQRVDGGSKIDMLNRYDILVLFVYVIMLELGFVPGASVADYSAANNDIAFNRRRVHALSTRLPSDWRRSSTFYDFMFVLGDFQVNQCRLVVSRCIEDYLLVNCNVYEVNNANFSMMVDPSQYVIDSRVSLKKRFQHVRQFATNFKNSIAIPAKLSILQANDVRTPKLQDLPPEIKIELEKLVKVDFFNDL